EPHVDKRRSPDMLVIDRVHLRARPKLDDVADNRRAGNSNFRRLSTSRVKPAMHFGFEHVQILMEISREKQKLRILQLKLPRGFVNPTLAKQNNLTTALKSVANRGPFFEGNLERT